MLLLGMGTKKSHPRENILLRVTFYLTIKAISNYQPFTLCIVAIRSSTRFE